MNKIEELRAQLEKFKQTSGPDILLDIIPLLKSNNWRDQIVGGILAYYFNATKVVDLLWDLIDGKSNVSWKIAIIAHEIDSNFTDKVKVRVHKIISEYKSKDRHKFLKNKLNEMTWLNTTQITLIFLSLLDNCIAYNNLNLDLGLDEEPEQRVLKMTEVWRNKLLTLGGEEHLGKG
ncbi:MULTISPECIES: hypothetical protein [unclassified Microbulbifer]|uniref:hypothetical protein n=1 Tax=unclassified Microbulbifer TaxID=2619833 RepID=UPI0027E520DF|nr:MULTISPECIES: hypothetical protein [unclassified Microbulbifer]